ncbi:hypothetical protein K505DRAFT_206996, partial [Melanomma pulvis-pyrius CBS 109.77]
PYTDPDIISLHVGPDKSRFRLHRMLLSQSPELDLKALVNDVISLPELDEITAHTLVHYLYTGKYQALEPYELSKEGAFAGYKLGACVYCAATSYKLPGLVELAKEKITSLGEDLTILDILSVARQSAFPGLPDDESWFPAYLEDAIKGAVSEDPDLFTRPGFVDQIEGDRKYRGVVMKAIVNTYSGGPKALSEQRTGLSTPLAESTFDDPPPTAANDPEPLHLEPIEPVENEDNRAGDINPSGQTAVTPNFIKEDAIQPEVVGIPAESLQAPEPFTDELGFGTSKTYQQMGKKADNAETSITSSIEPSAPAHTRSDSAIHITEIVPGGLSSESTDEKAVASPKPTDGAPLVVDGTSSAVPAPKKKKRSKK